ncbi:MAG TPA: FtsX-like permease family protein [Rubrivivax sp.]|nr:FtsX-like permease family protein [Rubrivivax sp.]
MNELSLAVRNLLRNRRRSLSTLLTLAIGLAAILLFGGFKTNIRYSMLTAYVRTGGHMQIQHADFFLYGSGDPTAYGISDYDKLLTAVRDDPVLKPMLAVATPMLRLSGLASNSEAAASRTVLGTGYVPSDINVMRRWNEFAVPIVHPVFVLEGAAPDAAIVGVGVARVLKLCDALKVANCPKPTVAAAAPSPPPPPPPPAPPGARRGAQTDVPGVLPADIEALTQLPQGDGSEARKPAGGGARVDLLASSGRGAPNVAALNVVAAEDQGFKELDEVSVILQMRYAQQLVFGRSQPRATAIMVQLKRTEDQAAAAGRLRLVAEQFGQNQPLRVREVEELNPFYVQSLQLFDVIFGFIFVLIGGIVLFTVGNTMNAAVVERTVEIGTLRAVGMRQRGIRRLFVLEGLALGVSGALLGVFIALLLAWITNHSGLTWLPPGSSERLPLQLRVAGEYTSLVVTSAGLVVIGTLSAWLPAWRAARLNVVEALRHA